MTNPPIALEDRAKSGARLYSPSAGRNKGPIGEQLGTLLPDNARVLEIASGTGEHAAHVCAVRPDITWQPSDIDPPSQASQNSWRLDVATQMRPSLPINTAKPHWQGGLDGFDAIYCANMIHIAPWTAAMGLAEGAGEMLKIGGIMMLYGPFQEGTDTAPSNLEFDTNLKRRNPEWGVRHLTSVKHIFADAGFNLTARIVMPKDNRLLLFTKLR